MAYFRCGQGSGGTVLKIQITTSSTSLYGQTITISKGGSTVGTTTFDNQGEAEYEVDEVGTYTVSVTMSGVTFSDTVEVTDTFDANIEATPDGSTVTPVNDIQIWLHCGNVWNKNYTTLSEVLADTTTLLALINSNNAVDYMARSTNWATSVCANSTAMTYIGANNYCANKLLSNSTWRTAICNSTYFESVLNVKVPTMTSNTTPSGKCFGSVISGDYAYYAFDGALNTYARTADAGANQYIGYDFGNAKKISKIQAYLADGGGENTLYVKIQGSNDNFSTSVDLTESTRIITPAQTRVLKEFIINPQAAYRYYRAFVMAASGRMWLYEMQLYGRS